MASGSLNIPEEPIPPFFCNDGSIIPDINRLFESLPTMSDEVFSYHVNSNRDDFALWIEHSFKRTDIAKKLMVVKDKASYRSVLAESLSYSVSNLANASSQGSVHEALSKINSELALIDTNDFESRISKKESLIREKMRVLDHLKKEVALGEHQVASLKSDLDRKSTDIENFSVILSGKERALEDVERRIYLTESQLIEKEELLVQKERLLKERRSSLELEEKALDESLKKLKDESRVAARDLSEKKEHLRILSSMVQSQEEEFEKLQSQVQGLRREYFTEREKLEDVESHLSDSVSRLKDTESRLLNRVRSVEDAISHEKAAWNKELSEFHRLISDLSKKRDSLVQEISNDQSRFTKVSEELVDKLQVLTSVKRSLSIVEKELSQKKSLIAEYKDLSGKVNALKNSQNSMKSELDKLNIEKDKLIIEINKNKDLSIQLDTKKKELNSIIGEINLKESRLNELNISLADFEKKNQEVISLDSKRSALFADISSAEEKFLSLNKSLESITQEIRRREESCKKREHLIDARASDLDVKERLLKDSEILLKKREAEVSDRERYARHIKDLNRDIGRDMFEHRSLRATIENHKRVKDDLAKQIEALRLKINDAKSNHHKLSSDIDRLTIEKERAKKHLERTLHDHDYVIESKKAHRKVQEIHATIHYHLNNKKHDQLHDLYNELRDAYKSLDKEHKAEFYPKILELKDKIELVTRK